MSIENELLGYIMDEIIVDKQAEPVNFDEPLVARGRVDSMGLLSILNFIQQKFGVDLLATGNPDDVESIEKMAAAVRRARGDGD